MRYKDPTVFAPFEDKTTGERGWLKFHFAGEIDRRAMKRYIRRAYKGRVHTRFIYEIMRRYLTTGAVATFSHPVPVSAPADATLH